MPTPSTVLSFNETQIPFIGSSVDLTLSFDNTGANTGYGPFSVLFLDSTGIDGNDGVTFDSASYLGGSITTTEIPLTVGAGAKQEITVHGETYEVTVPTGYEVGDTLLVFELPFGSFVPDQPPADIEITLDISQYADLQEPLNLEAQSGFIFGDTATGDNGVEIQTGSTTTTVKPELVNITKRYLGPEDETATGPNFLRQYEIVVDIAPGQTITNLDVTDLLPDTMQFVDVASIEFADSGSGGVNASVTTTDLATPDDGGLTSIGSSNTTENDVSSDNIPTPGGTLTRRFDSVTGTDSDGDIVLTIDFFVPRLDANSDVILNATTGDDLIDENQSQLGDNDSETNNNRWDPLDSGQGGDTVNSGDDTEEVYISPTVNDDPDDLYNDPDHLLEEQSIAIQKGVINNNLDRPDGFIPGDILKYTVEFQVSDYFAFEDVQITDVFSDGQRFYNPAGFEPVLSFTEHDTANDVTDVAFTNTVHTPVISGNGTTTTLDYLIVDETDIHHTNDGSGDTTLTFDVSGLLADSAQAGQDGQLVGGGVPDGGFDAYNLANDPNTIGLQNNPVLDTGFAGTTGTITFYTEILQDYSDNFPSGDSSVDVEDRLSNNATIEGAVLDVDTLIANGELEDDDTATEIGISSGELYKSIYAIDAGIPGGLGIAPGADTDIDPSDGLTGYTSGIDVAPGQLITYRLTYQLPANDVENFTLEDFFPLPAYDVADFSGSLTATSINSSSSGDLTNAPGSGLIEFGPAHNYPDSIDNLSINAASNSVLIDFGDYDDTTNSGSIIDILVTLPIQDEPIADGLLFTNQVHQELGNTLDTDILEDDAIIQITLRQPDLNITKGVVAFASDNTITFDPTNTAPSTITFNAPGFENPPGSPEAFSGSVASADLSTNPIDSNLTGGLAAGDIVTFAITVENLGGSPNGTFDVTIQDNLPTGFQIPDGVNELNLTGLNLQAHDGNGNDLDFTNLAGSDPDIPDGLLDGGIQLDDDNTNNLGSIDGYELNAVGEQTNPGDNIAIVTFDLEVAPDAPYLNSSTIENTATLASFANTEGGVDFDESTDTATVEVETPTAIKSIVATSETHTLETGDGSSANPREVTIGEIVRYRLVAEVPEGDADNFVLKDNLPDGHSFFNDDTAMVAFVSSTGDGTDATGISSSVLGTTPGIGNFGTTASDADTFVTLGDNEISSDASTNEDTYNTGTDVYFKLGDVTNSDRDDNDEFVVVEFNAIADNNDTIVNLAGGELVNDFEIYSDNTLLATSNDVYAEIVEPEIINLDQEVSLDGSSFLESVDADAQDLVTFQITFTNSGTSTAFEVDLTDNLPSDLENLSVTNISLGGGATGSTDTSSTNALDIRIDEIPVDGSVTVTYTAKVIQGVAPNKTITNTAEVTYTSLPGTGTSKTDTVNNPTGSEASSTSGTSTGERNGDDGASGSPNNYADSDPAEIDTDNISVIKSIISTGDDSTPDNNVIIGETIRYRLAVEIPEGNLTNFQIRDFMPNGLQYVADSAKVAFISDGNFSSSDTTYLSGSGINIDDEDAGIDTTSVTTVSTDTNATPTFDLDSSLVSVGNSVGANVNFSLSNISNIDNDGDAEFIVVEFDVDVTDVTALENQRIQNNAFRASSDETGNRFFRYVPANVLIDYGDAPDLGAGTGVGDYETTDKTGTASDGAAHGIVNDLFIGTIPDSDGGAFADATANVDDINPGTTAIDDEDGVTFPTTPFNPNSEDQYAVTLNVTNNTGDAAKLIGWIDFNQNGQFENTEEVIADIPTGTTGENVTLTWDRDTTNNATNDGGSLTTLVGNSDLPAIADISSGTTYARFRLSTDSNLTEDFSTGYALDGEVEDYQFNIGIDYGDAPDSTNGVGEGDYQTTDANSGAAHGIVNGLSIGSTVDDDSGQLEGGVNADADDNSNTGSANDEDGVTFPAIPLNINSDDSYSVTVDVNVPTHTVTVEDDFVLGFDGGTGWLDSSWTEVGETNGSSTGRVRVDNGILQFRRSDRSLEREFDLSSATEDATLTFDYSYNSLEIGETVTVTISNPNNGEPDVVFTIDNSGAASTTPNQSANITLPQTLLAGGASKITISSSGSNQDNDRVYIDNINISTDITEPATLVGWIDFDQDGEFEPGEAVTTNVTSSGAQTLTWDRDGSTTDGNGELPAANAIESGETYARFRLSTDPTLDANLSNGLVTDGEVEDHKLTIGVDYGDAPDSLPETLDAATNLTNNSNNFPDYKTTSGDGGAAHGIVDGFSIGSGVDDDSGLLESVDANLDDTTDTGSANDEDGVTFPATPLNINQDDSYSVDVAVNLPTTTLEVEDDFSLGFTSGNGWQSGAWTETGESDGATAGKVQVNSNILEFRNSGVSLEREFDFSSATEDATLTFDYSYDSLETGETVTVTISNPNNGEPDVVFTIDNSGVASTTPNQSANITLPQALLAGGSSKITIASSGADDDGDRVYIDNFNITTNVTEPATLVGWIDFDRDGEFELGEAVTTTVTSDGTETLTWDRDGNTVDGNGELPAANTIESGDTYARFRLSSDPDLNANLPNGFVDDGEVEDHQLNLGIDYGDAPDDLNGTLDAATNLTDNSNEFPDYQTRDADSGAAHGIVTNLSIGSSVDDDSGSLHNEAADADDTSDTGSTNDEDGVYFDNPLNINSDNSYSVIVNVTNNTGETAKLVGWVDFDQDGQFEQEEAVVANIPDGTTDQDASLTWDRDTFNTTGSLIGNGELPDAGTIILGDTYARFRLSTDADLDATLSTGFVDDGEVEDHKLNIGVDYGDAPDTGNGTGEGDYQTTSSDDGAAHGIIDGLSIGNNIDDDNGTLQSEGADADGADDNEVTLPTGLRTDSSKYTITVPITNTTGETATLVGWIDFNNNGQFESTEAVSTTVSSSGNATLEWNNNDGDSDNNLPSDIVGGDTYARFRLSTDPDLDTTLSTGFVDNGEVEDYQLNIIQVDYGDAPDADGILGAGNYDTTLDTDGATADLGGAAHIIIDGLSIGDTVDGDSGLLENTAATADDNLDTDTGLSSNDEDGIASFNTLSNNSDIYSVDVDVTNTTGSDATLIGWIDFDGDGIFEDDEATTALVKDGDSSAQLNWSGLQSSLSLPDGINPGTTYARFRLSSDFNGITIDDNTSVGEASDGEVEDHQIVIKNEITGTGSGDVINLGSTPATTANYDLIIGGAGQDTLTGGGGDDCFHYNRTSDGIDIITDFNNTTEADKLDFSDMFAPDGELEGITNPFGTYVTVLEAATPSDGTMIQVDFDGAGANYAKSVVFLQGYDNTVNPISADDFIF